MINDILHCSIFCWHQNINTKRKKMFHTLPSTIKHLLLFLASPRLNFLSKLIKLSICRIQIATSYRPVHPFTYQRSASTTPRMMFSLVFSVNELGLSAEHWCLKHEWVFSSLKQLSIVHCIDEAWWFTGEETEQCAPEAHATLFKRLFERKGWLLG